MAKLTSFERDVIFSSLLANERHSLPYDAGTLRSVIFPTRPFVAPREIAAAREKLLALGVFKYHSTARREWLEIQPDYRHNEGQNQTTYGDDTPEPQQQEMPLVLALVDSPMPRKNNPCRTESEQSRATESVARRPTLAPAPRAHHGETRTLSRGNDSGDSKRFALEEDDYPDDERFHDLARTLKLSEMTRNGRLWAKRHRENPRALYAALEDFRIKSPAERESINAAAYITAAFTGEVSRATA